MGTSEFRGAQFIGTVKAGFESPAKDYMEKDIDLQAYLQPNPTATYFARVEGDSMINSHIPDKSIVVIDKSLKVWNNCVVIATLDGERIIKHFVKTSRGTFLSPANPLYKPLQLTPEMEFSIWGVVTHVIIPLKK